MLTFNHCFKRYGHPEAFTSTSIFFKKCDVACGSDGKNRYICRSPTRELHNNIKILCHLLVFWYYSHKYCLSMYF